MRQYDDMNRYQRATEQTAIHPGSDTPKPDPEAINYLALGLAGESGEVAEKVKKFQREGDEQYLRDLEDELGDVLWYLARLSHELELDLGFIAQNNLDKLLDRQDRDQLTGEGDDR